MFDFFVYTFQYASLARKFEMFGHLVFVFTTPEGVSWSRLKRNAEHVIMRVE
jgi:hypothetical protein